MISSAKEGKVAEGANLPSMIRSHSCISVYSFMGSVMSNSSDDQNKTYATVGIEETCIVIDIVQTPSFVPSPACDFSSVSSFTPHSPLHSPMV